MFRLALALGKTVKQLGQELDSRELSEWLAYHQIEPLPDPYWTAGLICSTQANLWSTKKFTPEDFMPVARAKKPQSPEALLAMFQGVSAAQAAKASKQ